LTSKQIIRYMNLCTKNQQGVDCQSVSHFNTLTMMLELMVDDDKKSDQTEADKVEEAQTLAYEALIKAQEYNQALVRLKAMRALLSKPSTPLSKPSSPLSEINSPLSQSAPLLEPRSSEVDIALKVRTALESVALSRAEQSSTSAEGAASPNVEIAPSFTSLPKPESILNKTTSGPKAVGFAHLGRGNYAPPEASFPDPFGGPEGLWGDLDVDNLCGMVPQYEYEQEYVMHQPKAQQQPVQQQQPNKMERTPVAPSAKPESPKEDSIVAVKAVVAPAVKNVAFVAVAAPPEQSFPDPFGGADGEVCGDVDVDRLCGVIPYDDEDLVDFEQLKQIQSQQMKIQGQVLQQKAEEEIQAQEMKIKALEMEEKEEEEIQAQQMKIKALEMEMEKKEEEEIQAQQMKVKAQELQKKAEEAPVPAPTQTQPSEEPTKLEAPKEESPVAEKTAVTSSVRGVAAVGLAIRREQPFPDPFGGIDDDEYDVDVDLLCGVVPMITGQPKQIQAQQQQPTSPVASPAAAKPVEEPLKPVVEPTKPVSPQEPTVAAEAPVVSPAITVAAVGEAPRSEQPIVAVAEDTFSFDHLCGVTPDQVQPTSPDPDPSDARPVEAPKEESTVDTENTVTPTVTAEVTKIEAPKEEFTIETDNTVTPAEVAEVEPLEAAAAPTTPEAPKEESCVALETSLKGADLASEGQEKTEGLYASIGNLCGSPQIEETNEIQEEPTVSPAPKQEEPKQETPQAEEQNEMQEEPTVSPAPKQEEPEQEAPQAEEQNEMQEEPKVSPAPQQEEAKQEAPWDEEQNKIQEEAKPEEHLQLETQEHMMQAKAASICGCLYF
jgi:hypothetical protein